MNSDEPSGAKVGDWVVVVGQFSPRTGRVVAATPKTLTVAGLYGGKSGNSRVRRDEAHFMPSERAARLAISRVDSARSESFRRHRAVAAWAEETIAAILKAASLASDGSSQQNSERTALSPKDGAGE